MVIYMYNTELYPQYIHTADLKDLKTRQKVDNNLIKYSIEKMLLAKEKLKKNID